MKWFKKMLWRWTYQGRELEEENCKVSSNRLITRSDEAACSDDPILNFKVYSAVGGKVVEFRRYDRRNDNNETTTYIITNDQDFGERIAKIAMMENLKI
jgi:hypothetical protein